MYHDIVDQQVIVFDGDDTLWETEPLYDTARSRASEIAGSIGLDPTQFIELQKVIDIENVQKFGLTAVRFPTSSVMAVETLARNEDIDVSSETKRAVYEASASVFLAKAPLMPSAEKVLHNLAETHSLALLTKGDAVIQENRIRQSGLEDLFTLISIVSEKDESCFISLLQKLKAPAELAWSIGNSLKSDILPAHSLGMRTIWIDTHVWGHERGFDSADLDYPGVIRASRLSKVPRLIYLSEEKSRRQRVTPSSM